MYQNLNSSSRGRKLKICRFVVIVLLKKHFLFIFGMFKYFESDSKKQPTNNNKETYIHSKKDT